MLLLVPVAVQQDRSWEALLHGPQGINPLSSFPSRESGNNFAGIKEKKKISSLQHLDVSVFHRHVPAAHGSYPIRQNTLSRTIKHSNYTD